MKPLGSLSASILLGASALACSSATTTYVRSDNTTLGRVVVYRNGIAYFERTARVESDKLHLAVPGDKVDDFLKSLTVTDVATGQPAPVSYPNLSASGGGDSLTQMDIQLQGSGPHQLRLTYVTEAASWKSSYRVVLGKGGKVDFQGWAIIDNTSGEDWEKVKLGVGSSSALSFRYDLRSVRAVRREMLRSDTLFAEAPPTGGATMSNQQVVTQRVFGEISDDQIAANEPAPASATTEGVVRADSERVVETKAVEAAPLRPTTMAASSPRLSGNHSLPPPPPSAGGGKRRMATLSAVTPAGPSAPAANASTANRWRLSPAAYAGTNQIVVEGYADAKDGDKAQASLDRANRVREQLIRDGIDPSRVVAVAQGEKAGRKAGVRIVEGQSQETKKSDVGKTQAVAAAAPPEALDPIGASHFESPSAMSIARGTSAMVSIFDAKAEGDVVYLYDPESPRGSKDFAFKAVRLRNPTDSVLESGPVTVFGEGRFIGEGIAEPIPAKSIAFVPFALDRQIVLEQVDGERDEIARVVSVQRGVLATETQHIRRTSFSLHNRMSEPTTVYVKHTVPAGYALTASPKSTERLGTAHLIRVEAPSNGKTTFVIEESTPVTRTIDLRSLVDMDAVRLYLRSNKAIDPLRSQLEALLHLQQEIGNIEQRVQTLRDQMTAYRERMEELHVQIVTLKAVKTGGPMMKSLEKKLQEMSDRLSQATVDVASQQENLLVTRIRLQDGIAELSLEKKAKTE